MPARIVAGLVAALWSLFVLPPQMVVWSGLGGTPAWLRWMNRAPVYDVLRDGLDDIGLTDHYLVFGVAIAPAMLLAWWAMSPALRTLGWSGRVLSVLWLVLGPLTALSYLNHDDGAPLRAIWGAELFALLTIGAWAIVAAAVAPRGRGIPVLRRVLVGATALFGIGGTLLGGYYPHGTMIGVGVLAACLAATMRPGREARPDLTPSA